MIKYYAGGVLLAINKNTSSSGTLDSIFTTCVTSKPLTNPFAYMFNQTTNDSVSSFSCVRLKSI